MRAPREHDESRYAHLRGPAEPTLDNLIRWERTKLWDAAQECLALIEDLAPASEHEIEALWADVEFSALRETMKTHRARIGELRTMQAEAALVVGNGPPQGGIAP